MKAMTTYSNYPEIDIELLLNSSSQVSERNTWESYNHVINQAIELEDDRVIIWKHDKRVILDYQLESLLSVLVDYNYLPKSFVLDFLKDLDYISIKGTSILCNMIDLGMVWVDRHRTGDFIRPTLFTYKLFGKENPEYRELNYSQIKHDMAISKVMLEVMTENPNNLVTKYFKDIIQTRESNLIGKYKVKYQNGIKIISEKDYDGLYGSLSLDAIVVQEKEQQIFKEIKSGIRETLEFREPGCFPIVKIRKDKMDSQKAIDSYYMIKPDITVPIHRDSYGEPQSISIEVELSMKSEIRYHHILGMYKNNNKYGVLIYYCASQKIIDRLNKVLNEKFEGNLGTCAHRFVLWSPPKL